MYVFPALRQHLWCPVLLDSSTLSSYHHCQPRFVIIMLYKWNEHSSRSPCTGDKLHVSKKERASPFLTTRPNPYLISFVSRCLPFWPPNHMILNMALSVATTLIHYQTTNFRLFQTERVCRRQFQIWRKWQKVIQMGRKHCWKRKNRSLRSSYVIQPRDKSPDHPRYAKCGLVMTETALTT